MGTKLFPKRFHPCCGLYLYGALRWASIIGGFAGEPFQVIHFVFEVQRNFISWKQSYNNEPFQYYFRLLLWAIYVSQIFVAASLHLFLFKAVGQKNNIKLLKIYIKGFALNILIALTTMCVYAIQFPAKSTTVHYVKIIVWYLAKTYITIAVYYFIREIRKEAEIESGFRDLDDYELKQFENGEEYSISRSNVDNMQMKPFLDRIQYVKYKEEEFEISLLELQLDKRAPLGSGTFGTVYKAILCKNTDTSNVLVAVKTTNPTSTNVEHFKALLSELKVMTVIGNHKNIVNLIGACTENIKKRKLYIVVELCAFGNIQNFLKSQRGTFVDLNDEEENSATIISHIAIPLNTDEDLISTKDLVKWAKEIADGMDFLQSRRVVHGDLAARNVLLTEDKIAKITDFGLSRQLYNYSVYVKTQNSPLPWRWLALETIVDMCFSTQSDIWSYGVTLWELFQLGETPWQGYNFGLDFVKELKHGKRMKKPTYANSAIYQMMLNCWDECPQKRPTFQKLSEDFKAIFLELNCKHLPTNVSYF